MKKIIILLITFFAINQIVFADSIPKQEFELIKSEYEFLKTQTKTLQDNINTERKNHYDYIENTYLYITILISVIVAILAGFGFKTMNDFKKSLNLKLEEFEKVADDIMNKKLAKLINEDQDVIYKIIENYDRETQLKKETDILVLNDGKQKFNIKDALKGFKTPTVKNFSDFFEFTGEIEKEQDEKGQVNSITDSTAIEFKKEITGFDMIIINGTGNEQISEAQADMIIKKYPETKFVFFKVSLKRDEIYTNTSSVMMPAQLAGNIINMLKA